MANSRNTLWLVSCVSWKTERNGTTNVKHCDSRAYRSEKSARERYKSIVNNLREDGYSISDLDVPELEEYEGIQARRAVDVKGQHYVSRYAVYIDRNPVWSPG